MKYIVPSSKIVFTDFMLLLVALLMGINSVMSFSEQIKEHDLPPVKLSKIVNTDRTGASDLLKANVSVLAQKDGSKAYYYNKKEVSLCQLMKQIKKASVTALVLRIDQKTVFEWEEFCQLSSKFMKAGVKKLSYAVNNSRERKHQ